jgi:Tol biopolymer transport system component
MTRFALAALVALVGVSPLSAVQEAPSDTLLTVGHYLDFERVSDPQISPDGRQVVYTRAYVDKMNDRFESAIWIMDADGGRSRYLVDGSSPRWSPDGTRIAYLADGDPEGTQLFVRWMDAEGAISQITRETETPSNIRWGPRSEHVYFQRIVPVPETWTVELPTAPEGASWTPAPRIVDRMHYRFDRVGFLPSGWNHLFRVPADGGTAMQLTRGEFHVGGTFVPGVGSAGYDISPDGTTLYFDGLMEDTDLTYLESHIWALDIATGAVRQLTQRRGPWAGPVVSPDGQRIAYTGFDWTSQTYKTTELHVMNADGSGARIVSGRGGRWPLLHRRRPGHAQRPPRFDRWRAPSGDVRNPHALAQLDDSRGDGGRRPNRSSRAAGRGPLPDGRRIDTGAPHARERRRPRRQAAG